MVTIDDEFARVRGEFCFPARDLGQGPKHSARQAAVFPLILLPDIHEQRGRIGYEECLDFAWLELFHASVRRMVRTSLCDKRWISSKIR